MVPELVKKEDIVFPHEWEEPLPDEAHFIRIWSHYRYYVLNKALNRLIRVNEAT